MNMIKENHVNSGRDMVRQLVSYLETTAARRLSSTVLMKSTSTY